MKCEWKLEKDCNNDAEYVVGQEGEPRRLDLHLCLKHLHDYADGLLKEDRDALQMLRQNITFPW